MTHTPTAAATIRRFDAGRHGPLDLAWQARHVDVSGPDVPDGRIQWGSANRYSDRAADLAGDGVAAVVGGCVYRLTQRRHGLGRGHRTVHVHAEDGGPGDGYVFRLRGWLTWTVTLEHDGRVVVAEGHPHTSGRRRIVTSDDRVPVELVVLYALAAATLRDALRL